MGTSWAKFSISHTEDYTHLSSPHLLTIAITIVVLQHTGSEGQQQQQQECEW